jgi:AcrR family transcriptional regulator
MNDVAERLRITKPTLYHYFRNKEEILLECYRTGTALIQQKLDEIAAHGGSGLEKVRAFIYAYSEIMTVNFGRCVMRLDDGDLSASALAEVRACKRKIDRSLRRLMEEGIADGSIEPCDAKIATFAAAGAVNWMCMWYDPDGSLSAEDIAEQFARIFMRGLASPKRRRNGQTGLSARRRTGALGQARLSPATSIRSKDDR